MRITTLKTFSYIHTLETMDTSPYLTKFNKHVFCNEHMQNQLNQEHQLCPFSPRRGLLVIRFSDMSTMQTNWTKLASALEKMRRDDTRVVALLELKPTDEKQKDLIIGGGLIPYQKTQEKCLAYYLTTRMMNEQNGRVIRTLPEQVVLSQNKSFIREQL